MRWFVEEKNFKSEWSPAVYYSKEPPSEKTAAGQRTFRKAPVEIDGAHYELPFKEIVRIYGHDKDARLHLSMPE